VTSPLAGAKSSPATPSVTPAPASTPTSRSWSNSPTSPPPASPKAPSARSWNNKPRPSANGFPVLTAAPPVPCIANPASCNGPAGPSPRANRSATVPPVGGTFSPQRPLLRLTNHAYSPAAWRLLAAAAGRLDSFADAAFALSLAGLTISPQHVRTLAQEVGADLARQRDAKAALGRRRLPARVSQTPALVAVEVDGGRLRTRAADAGPGVHAQENKEDKVACLVTLQGDVYAHDPQPEPPPSFLQPRRVERLVRQMAGQAGDALSSPAAGTAETTAEPAAAAAEPAAAAAEPTAAAAEPSAEPWAPRKQLRTCVASMADSRAFGRLVAAEAQERDFYRAPRRAFVADGAAYNWAMQRTHFADFEPIVDFLHVLCYVYAAAWAVRASAAERWNQYVAWLTACWQGRVAAVLAELQTWQVQVGRPPPREELPRTDARRAVAEALSYLTHNAPRMDYPRYRQVGLPITSSLAESLVGEFNARVKSRQHYWNRPAGAEAILQLRAAVLSEDGRLERYFTERPGSPYRRRAQKA
jgi:hypothetical protein